MNVRCSNTPNNEAEALSGHAELDGEKLTAMQQSNWNLINWKTVEMHVNRIQVRITKAVINGNWNLVKRLSYLLTHSFYAKLLAVRKVIQNKGKRTAGIDGELWSTPKSKINATLSLSDKWYKARPLKRVFIEKYGSDKKRP
ncbi:group II intron reverse transcriptase/maturase, partial [Methanococcoides sp. SA1]|nr:group II intron reverse transcriptase/maturase [Methanococcoides sp. SA1]